MKGTNNKFPSIVNANLLFKIIILAKSSRNQHKIGKSLQIKNAVLLTSLKHDIFIENSKPLYSLCKDLNKFGVSIS